MDKLLLNLKNKIDDKPEVNKHLFEKGFLITSRALSALDEFPFYSNWMVEKIGELYFIIHKKTNLFTYPLKGKTYFLIGHAYNPFDMTYDENTILQKIAESENSIEIINQLTGIFVFGYLYDGNKVFFLNDASGIQNVCYGVIKEVFKKHFH